MNERLQLLQSWFARQCDGKWEHDKGIRIETLDNPGWHVAISVEGTPLFAKAYEERNVTRSDTDWYICRVRDGAFQGYGGPENLVEVLDAFLAWIDPAQSH